MSRSVFILVLAGTALAITAFPVAMSLLAPDRESTQADLRDFLVPADGQR